MEDSIQVKKRPFDLEWTLARASQMLFRARSGWQLIKAEQDSVNDIFKTYLYPVLLLLPIGYLAASYARGDAVLSPEMFVPAAVGYGAALLFVYGAALETQRLLPKYGGACSRESACKLVAYALTPLYFSGFLLAFPEIRIAVAGLAVWGMANMGVGLSMLTGLERSKARDLLLFVFCRYVLLGSIIVIAATLCVFVIDVISSALLHAF